MKHLVLLGAGHAHVHLISSWATRALPGVELTLVTPQPRQIYSGMVPGFVAGHYALEDCTIELPPLLKNTGIRWLHRSASALDAQARSITLDDGSTLAYDWLSINTGPVQDRRQLEQSLPGCREHGLFVRPLEVFATLWPQVLALASTRALRVAVIGGGAAGIELAMAVRQRLRLASITLVSGGAPVAAHYPPSVQRHVLKALKRRNITLLLDRASGIQSGEVLLGSGARLACDVPLLATGAQAPAWLAGSGLALDAQGFVAVDACQRSSSHPEVFACGDVSTRMDRALARNGVHAVRAGPALAAILAAVLSGNEPRAHQPPQHTLNLLSCGDRHAIASWGPYAAQGRWVWWLKDWIDRAFVRRYRRES